MSEMKMVPLGIAAPFTTGATPPTRENSYYGEGYRWANISDLGSKFISETSKSITQAGYESSGFGPMAEPGDLLFSFKLSVGAVSIAAAPMLTNEAIATFKTGHLLIPTYAYYMLPLYLLRAAGHNIYGAPMLNDGIMRRTKVPVPPLETQRAIADYLDRETGEIDAMLGRLEELAEVLELRRDAVILQELQRIPTRIQLTLAVDVISGSGFPDKHQGVSTEELPFYKVGSLSSAVNGFLGDDENTVSRVTADELRASVVPSGSILMAKIGAALMLARFVQTTKPACIDNNMQALVPRDGVVDPRFLTYAMTEVSIPSLVKNGPVPTVDVMGMKMTHISRPPLEEQRRIADHLDEVTGKIDAMLVKVAELKALLIERRAALITDVVTGRKDITRA